MMNYQSAGVNNSMLTNERSLGNWADQTQVLQLRGDTASRHNMTAASASYVNATNNVSAA